MTARATHPGHSTLRLLAERSTIQILKELTDAPLRPHELRSRLPGVAHSVLMRRLGELVRRGVVMHERSAGIPPRAHYSLADAGRILLQIPEAGARWERQWTPEAWREAPGAGAVRVLADERTRAIMQVLAGGPLRPIDLERRMPGMGRSATRQRLAPLVRNRILVRSEEDGQVRYALTAAGRGLESVATLAARWELLYPTPQVGIQTMMFSTKAEYGVRVMVALARRASLTDGELDPVVPLAEIAERDGLPLAYLEHLVARLRKAGLIDSRRGARGGYMLARPAAQITMAEVVEALEGSIAPIECISVGADGEVVCARESDLTHVCPTKLLWTRVRGSIVSTLTQTTLADLVSDQAGAGARPARPRPATPALSTNGRMAKSEPMTTGA
jgi:Rrf2 family cysteine metabolism transcriptional repressor